MTSEVAANLRTVRDALEAVARRLQQPYCVAEDAIEAEERRLLLRMLWDGLDGVDAVTRELHEPGGK